MNTKHNTYLDLSKLSEEERKEVFKLIKEDEDYYDEKYSPLLKYSEPLGWYCGLDTYEKTELTFQEWKSMMEGNSGERLISLENFLRDKLDEIESMHDYAVATDTIRCWIDEYNN